MNIQTPDSCGPDRPEARFRAQEGIMGRWIIVHGTEDNLAWSGSRWVAHRGGLPMGGVQISNWNTREEAEAYAKEHCKKA